MNLDGFIAKYNGKFVEAGGTSNALNQCVDLVNQYIDEVLHLPKILWTNAVDFPSKIGTDYDYIKNTPTGVPQKGDFVIWGGTYGHIGIFIEGDTNSFRSFDENYPTGSPSVVVNHNYNNVLGWMHPKVTPQATDALAVCMTDREKFWKERDEYKAKYETELLENQKLNEQIATSAQTNKDYATQTYEAQKERDTLIQQLKEIDEILGASATQKERLEKLINIQTHDDKMVKEWQSLYDLVFTNFIYKRAPQTTSWLKKLLGRIKK